MDVVGEPLSVLLERLACELSRLSSDAAHIEEMVNDLPWDHLADSATGMATIQSLDYFRQSLEALAEFTGSLSAQAAEDWQVRTEVATAGLKLTRLALHLSGHVHAEPDDDDDLELFAAG